MCAWNAIVSGSRLSRATVQPLQRKHCAFSFELQLYGLFLESDVVAFLCDARSGAANTAFRRSEIIESC